MLLQKLYHCRIQNKMFKLLISYFSKRHVCVKRDEKVSFLRLLDHGVPQGSIFEPLPFLTLY